MSNHENELRGLLGRPDRSRFDDVIPEAPDFEQWVAYVDGSLDSESHAEFDRYLAAHPEHHGTLASIREFVAAAPAVTDRAPVPRAIAHRPRLRRAAAALLPLIVFFGAAAAGYGTGIGGSQLWTGTGTKELTRSDAHAIIQSSAQSPNKKNSAAMNLHRRHIREIAMFEALARELGDIGHGRNQAASLENTARDALGALIRLSHTGATTPNEDSRNGPPLDQYAWQRLRVVTQNLVEGYLNTAGREDAPAERRRDAAEAALERYLIELEAIAKFAQMRESSPELAGQVTKAALASVETLASLAGDGAGLPELDAERLRAIARQLETATATLPK